MRVFQSSVFRALCAIAIGIFILFVVGVVALIQLIRRRSEKHNLQKKGAPANEKQEE